MACLAYEEDMGFPHCNQQVCRATHNIFLRSLYKHLTGFSIFKWHGRNSTCLFVLCCHFKTPGLCFKQWCAVFGEI